MSRHLSAEEEQKEVELSRNKRDAVSFVSRAVKIGQLPAVQTLKCADCSGPAKHYHHESYQQEHWLDVIPLCHKCHRARHAKKRKDPNKAITISVPGDTKKQAREFRSKLNAICAGAIGGQEWGALSRALVAIERGELVLVPREVYEARGLGELVGALRTVEDFVSKDKEKVWKEAQSEIDRLAPRPGFVSREEWEASKK